MTTTPFGTEIAFDVNDTPAARFGGVPLPRGLREDAENMSWSTFSATYSPRSGPLRLGYFACTDDRTGRCADRDAVRLRHLHRHVPLPSAGVRRSHRHVHPGQRRRARPMGDG